MRSEAGLALAVFLGGAFAQSLAQSPPVRPAFDAFEVATIKPTAPDHHGGRYITMQGAHRFVAIDYSLKSLIGAAYNLTPGSISGGAPWIESDRYDILAETPNLVRPNLDEEMAMLRKLLAERFSLVFHRERKEMSVYALSVAAGGSRLKPGQNPDGPPELINVVYPDRIRLPARNATMGQFASMMQRAVVDRPVIDKTALVGRYDFDLEWTPDETQFGGQLPPITTEITKPDLFAAIRQQLGLKLEAARGTVEVLVIVGAEHPSDN